MDEIDFKIENPVYYDRNSFPVGSGFPFAKGVLKNAGNMSLYDKGKPVPMQVKPLGFWKDRSVKWAYAEFLSDIKSLENKQGRVENPVKVMDDPERYDSLYEKETGGTPVPRLAQGKFGNDKTIVVGNGLLKVALSGNGILKDIFLKGKSLLKCFEIVVQDTNGNEHKASMNKDSKIWLHASGNLHTVVGVKGSHRDVNNKRFLDFVLKFHIYADNPVLRVDYKFINREEPEYGVDIKSIKIIFKFNMKDKIHRTIQQMHRGTYWLPRFVTTSEPVEMSVDENRAFVKNYDILGEDPDKYPPPLKNGLDNVFPYVDVCADGWGVTSSFFETLENYPKGILADGNSVTFKIYPESQEPLHLNQGMAKTHTLYLNFYHGKRKAEDKFRDIVMWNFPLFVSISPEYCRHCRVEGLERTLKYQPDKYPKTEVYFRRVFGRTWVKGMMDFGDDTSEGYRQRYMSVGYMSRDTVWLNNECDFIWASVNQYLRTGQYHSYYDARISAQHQIDVDFIHYSPDKFRHHSTPAHSAGHTSASSYPSHMWTEGLLAYYFISGEKDFLETARAIGDNLILWTNERKFLLYSDFTTAREGGWALIALCSLYDATGEKKYLEASKKIVDSFFAREKKTGALIFNIRDYYAGEKSFITSVALIGLKKYYLIKKDDKIKKLFLSIVDGMAENTFLPEGISHYEQYIKTNYVGAPDYTYPLYADVFAFAYELTEDKKYVVSVMRELEIFLTQMPYKLDTVNVAQIYRCWIEFLCVADGLQLLKQFEFRY